MGRFILVAIAAGSLAWPQTILEHAGVAAGSTVGSVAGKQVSNGVTKILEKTAKQTEVAAKNDRDVPPPPVLRVGAAAPKQIPYNVPPPPPLRRAYNRASPEPKPEPEPAIDGMRALPLYPPAPPPPVMTASDFAKISAGMPRKEVWDMGRNAIRILKTENGHLEEILRYLDGDTVLGVVHLVDGEVASVDANP